MTFHKYKKIWRLGYEDVKDIFLNPDDKIIIQEKIDGANFRFMIKEGNIIFGSRGQELSEDKDHKYEKNFRRCIEFVLEVFWSNVDISEAKQFEGLIFYGECCVRHSLAYDWDKIPPYLGFDIFSCDQDRFYEYEQTKILFETLGLKMVPLIKETTASEIIKEKIDNDYVPQSAYAPRQAEGVVFKNYNNQMFAKYVTDNFKEKNKETFGGGKKLANDDSERFIAMYCTNARIDKQIFKLVDGEEKLEMPLMAKLPRMVWDDIWEEEWKEINNKKQFILDFGRARKLLNKRCTAVLIQMITNNVLIKK